MCALVSSQRCASSQSLGPIHGERKRHALLKTAIKLDAPHRLAVPFDPEVRDRFDGPEPSPEIPRPRFDLTDHHQDPIATDPFFGPAPEGEPARIVGVVTEDGLLAAQGVGEMGALIPVAGEDERARIVEQAELFDPIGHLVPAVEIERGIGSRIDESPPASTIALQPAITILADRNRQNHQGKAGAGGKQPASRLGAFFESSPPTCSPGSERATRARSSPSAARPGENTPRR